MELREITEAKVFFLIGMDFYGDPFTRASAWEEENEIGVLFRRFGDFYRENQGQIKHNLFPEAVFEGHFSTPETLRTGSFDVFVGALVDRLQDIPLSCVARQLPLTAYGVITLSGEEITSDWHKTIKELWPPGPAYALSGNYSLTCYDARFKGMDRIGESKVDVYIPVTRV